MNAPRLLALPAGRPAIADGAWVAPGATVVGAVTPGPGSSVWYGAVLRGDGDGDGISVGHRAVLHGCTIGDDTLVGMGAVVLNGARLIPAGAYSARSTGSVTSRSASTVRCASTPAFASVSW